MNSNCRDNHHLLRAAALIVSMIMLLATAGCEQSPTTSVIAGIPNEESANGVVESKLPILDANGKSTQTFENCLPADVRAEWNRRTSSPDALPNPGAVERSAGDAASTVVEKERGHPAGVPVNTISLGRRPFGVAVSRDGVACVTLLDGAAVAILDTKTGTFSEEVAVGSIPTNVAIDPKGEIALVTCQGSGKLSVIDIANRTPLADVDIGGSPFYVAFSPNGRTAYTTSNFNEVTAIDASTRQIEGTVDVGYAPNGIAMQTGQRLLFASCVFDGTIHVIDPRQLQPVAVFETVGKVQELALSRNGHRLYTADEFGSFMTLDLDTNSISSLPLAGGAFGMAITPDYTRAYLSIPNNGDVVVVLLETMEVESTIHVGGRPRRIAFTQSGDCAVVANEAGGVHFIR